MTSSNFFASFFQGLSISTLGPSLVDLEDLYQVDTKTISFTFLGGGLGYTAGSLVCGFVYDMFNYEVQFFLATFVMGVACAVSPWTGSFVGFTIFNAVHNIAGGFIDAGLLKKLIIFLVFIL